MEAGKSMLGKVIIVISDLSQALLSRLSNVIVVEPCDEEVHRQALVKIRREYDEARHRLLIEELQELYLVRKEDTLFEREAWKGHQAKRKVSVPKPVVCSMSTLRKGNRFTRR